MLTMFRLAPVRFTSLGLVACFFAVGSFDTLRAQNLTVNPSTLVFTAATGGNPNPATQQVTVGGTGNYIISTNASWIFASTGAFAGTGGSAPDTITVQINSTSLASGSYSGTITLQPTGGPSTTISVSLTVSGSGTTNSTLSAVPSQLTFGYELGQALPAAQTTQILSSGIGLPISFSINQGNTGPNTCPVGWLQATVPNLATPTVMTVSIANPGNALSQGTCSGNISITSITPTNGTTTTLVGVVLFVSAANSPLLNVTVPNALSSVTLQQGTAPVQFGITLASSDNNSLGFTAQVTAGLGWLAISPAAGTVPGGGGTTNINVQVTPGTVLSPGQYLGSIQINSSGLLGGSLKIPVTMNLLSKSAVTVTPTGRLRLISCRVARCRWRRRCSYRAR